MPLDRPIPAFYCCYLLRSTIRHANVYVGSTPHPVRRLGQHNGETKGGAVRTSRPSLRPWEMACIVTGFPSHIAALQFEWAWQNPHVTLHIPLEARIQHSTAKKRSGQPKRPRHSVTSLLQNLHLLLRVQSFSRWPLEVRFFAEDVHKSWLKHTKTAADPIRDSLPVIQHFPPAKLEIVDADSSPKSKKRKASHGIGALDINYTANKAHVEKGKSIIDFEREDSCAICQVDLEHNSGVYTICPNSDCEAVTHVKCLSKHFLSSKNDEDILIPIKGTCPSCKTELAWIDIVKELTLRMRGQKEVEKLLKKKRVPKGKATASQAAVESSEDEDMDVDEDEAMDDFAAAVGTEAGDKWHEVDEEESDTGSMTSNASTSLSQSQPKRKKAAARPTKKLEKLSTVIEDSDFDEAEVIE